MDVSRRRAVLLTASIVATFIFLRVALWITPDADFDVLGYNIHHLFTGLVLVSLAGIPLVLGVGSPIVTDALTLVFGAGLSMALDEWVYLIATDGSNQSYLLPVSFWGGLTAVVLVVAYIGVITAVRAERARRGNRFQ